MGCPKEVKDHTGISMYICVGYSAEEYLATLKPWLKSPVFDNSLDEFHPVTIHQKMEHMRAALNKHYAHEVHGTDGVIQRVKDPRSAKVFHRKRMQLLQAIKEAAQNALLEFKYAVVDYIKQDGIQPGCLPAKERAVLWKVDAYYMDLIRKVDAMINQPLSDI